MPLGAPGNGVVHDSQFTMPTFDGLDLSVEDTPSNSGFVSKCIRKGLNGGSYY